MAYYATTAPAGYTRDTKTMNSRTGGRLYNPYAKMNKNFDYDPCRSSGPAMEALMGKGGAPEIIRLKQHATGYLHPPKTASPSAPKKEGA